MTDATDPAHRGRAEKAFGTGVLGTGLLLVAAIVWTLMMSASARAQNP